MRWMDANHACILTAKRGAGGGAGCGGAGCGGAGCGGAGCGGAGCGWVGCGGARSGDVTGKKYGGGVVVENMVVVW